MGVEFSSRFCKTCDTQRKVERKTPNHILHLLLTIFLGAFTFGIGSIIWIIVWILLSIKIGGWRCSVCGGNSFK